MRHYLYLFVGAPGAGKTTVAHLIHRQTGAVHLWADHERQANFKPVTHSKRESNQLYELLNTRANQLLAEGRSVIFDTNFNYLKDRQHLRSIAQKHNAKTLVIWMQTPLDVARERALHENHSARNKYSTSMTPAEFEHLTDHLEPPTEDENVIKIDGSNIDEAAVKQQLGI